MTNSQYGRAICSHRPYMYTSALITVGMEYGGFPPVRLFVLPLVVLFLAVPGIPGGQVLPLPLQVHTNSWQVAQHLYERKPHYWYSSPPRLQGSPVYLYSAKFDLIHLHLPQWHCKIDWMIAMPLGMLIVAMIWCKFGELPSSNAKGYVHSRHQSALKFV